MAENDPAEIEPILTQDVSLSEMSSDEYQNEQLSNVKGQREPESSYVEPPNRRQGLRSQGVPGTKEKDPVVTQSQMAGNDPAKIDSAKIKPILTQDISPSVPGTKEKVPVVTQRQAIRPELPLIFMVIAFLVVVTATYINIREPSVPPTTDLFNLYEKEIEKIHSKYTNQTDRFWTTFLSSFEPILTTDEPDLPAVIMMAVPDDQHSMGLCFMQHVAEVLNKILGGMNPPSYVDGSKLSSLDADEQKVELDEQIQKIVESQQRTVLISGLENLNPKAILLFHGYCDNSEAVFKNIAIIFMVRVPDESNFRIDEEVYAYLSKQWIELGAAKTRALLSRMANNVAIMQKSDHFIC